MFLSSPSTDSEDIIDMTHTFLLSIPQDLMENGVILISNFGIPFTNNLQSLWSSMLQASHAAMMRINHKRSPLVHHEVRVSALMIIWLSSFSLLYPDACNLSREGRTGPAPKE